MPTLYWGHRSWRLLESLLIDLDDGHFKVHVQDETVTLNVLEAMKHPGDSDNYFRVEVLEEVIETAKNQMHLKSPLERV